MYESPAELADLQGLLDRSLAGVGEHLRSIIGPGRTLTATQTVAVLTGMCTLVLASVTASGEPRVSGVDGHLLHARFVFTTSSTAVKARHLRRRPAVSVAHVVGDDLGVFCHGRAVLLNPEQPDFAGVEDHLVGHYGSSPSSWGPAIDYWRVEPQWMVAYAADPEELVRRAAVGGADHR